AAGHRSPFPLATAGEGRRIRLRPARTLDRRQRPDGGANARSACPLRRARAGGIPETSPALSAIASLDSEPTRYDGRRRRKNGGDSSCVSCRFMHWSQRKEGRLCGYEKASCVLWGYLISASDTYSTSAGLPGPETRRDASQALALSGSRKTGQRRLHLTRLPGVGRTPAEPVQDLPSFRASDALQHLHGPQMAERFLRSYQTHIG